MRRMVVCLIACAVVATCAVPARAQVPPVARVIVLWLDGTTLQDWMQPGLTAFGSLLDEGAVALLQTPSRSEDATQLRADAAATVAAGRWMRGNVPVPFPPWTGRSVPIGGACTADTPVSHALDSAGIVSAVLGDAGGTDRQDRAIECSLQTPGSPAIIRPGPLRDAPTPHPRSDPNFPTGVRADVPELIARARAALDSQARLVVVDLGDTARVERALGSDPVARQRWIADSMVRADRVLRALRSAASNDTIVMAVSPTPSVGRARDGVRLGVVAFAGGSLPAGRAGSATTRRAGLVSATDLAPTILGWLGVPKPPGMTGAVMGVAPRAADRVATLERTLVSASRSHLPVTVTLLALALAVLWAAAIVVLAQRARAPKASRLPRGTRDVISTAAMGVVWATAAALFLPARSPTISVAQALATGAGLALVSRVALGRERGLLASLSVLGIAAVVDALAGSPMSGTGALELPIAASWHPGVTGPVVAGMVVAAPTLAGAIVLDRRRTMPPVQVVAVVASAAAAVVLMLALPRGGGTAGIVAVAGAFAVAVAGMLSRTARRRALTATVAASLALAGIAAAGTALTAGVSGDDALMTSDQRSHALQVRLDSARALVPWVTPMAVLLVAPPIVTAVRRRQLSGRALWGRPLSRASAAAVAGGALAAIVALVGGVLAATWMLALAALWWATTFAARDRWH